MFHFTLNQTKAMQTLLWILNQKQGMSIYNIMKVMFAADCYHLTHYGRPIYGEEYGAWKLGTVPLFMYNLTGITQNVPYYRCSDNCLEANSAPDMRAFSQTDIEALQYGMSEYADLTFEEVKQKNHQHPAWKKHELEVQSGQKNILIDYADMIEDPEVLKELQELGPLTENMVF